MQSRTLLSLTTVLVGSGLSYVALPTTANAGPLDNLRHRPQAVACAQLPAKLLGGNIKYANAQIVPANTAPGAAVWQFHRKASEYGDRPCQLLSGGVEL